MSTAAPLLVSASCADADGFLHTLLGRSLALPVHRGWQPRLALANGRPLAEAYNRALEEADPEALILFCHDDVWLGEQPLEPLLAEALERFDLVGVAGNRRRQPDQICWWLRPGDGAWDHPHLVGGIHHGDDRQSHPTPFGPSPAPAVLLDGVALAARAGVLQAAGVRFDQELAFHFYDLDLCRCAEAAGLRLGVWPLPLVHASGGNAGSPAWQEALGRYQRKWGDSPPSPPPSPSQSPTPSTHQQPMPTAPPSFEITTSRQFLAWMVEQRLALAFTTYQIGKLFALGLKANGELAAFERTFNRCMGLCPSADGNGFWMSSLYQVWRFENILGPGEQANGHDRLYACARPLGFCSFSTPLPCWLPPCPCAWPGSVLPGAQPP